MIIGILNLISNVIMWFGLIMSSWSKPDEKKRQNGCLIAACATFFNGMLFLININVFCSILMFGISIFDFWIYDKWRKRYKELSLRKLSDARERFLKEMTEYKF